MTEFDCLQFERWLDDGGALRPRAGESPAENHAQECPACGEKLAAERDAGQAFAAIGSGIRMPPAPPGFAERVMARVALAPQETALGRGFVPALVAAGDAVPWWVRAAAQPSSVLALALAGVAVAFAPQLARVARGAPQWSAELLAVGASLLAQGTAPVAVAAGNDPWVRLAVTLALLPLVGVASIGLYRLGIGMATPHPGAVRNLRA